MQWATLYTFQPQNLKPGYELYKSNGTNAGTTLLKDFLTGEQSSNPQQFLKKNNNIYFSAENNSYNWSVYKIDSTGTVTKAVPSQPSLTCYDVADNGLIFFTSYSLINSMLELWRSDGTANGTFMLTDKIRFPGNTSNTQTIRTAGNKAFFVGYDEINGYELWVSDGTVAGTKIVKDIAAGIIGSSPYSLFPLNGYMIFGASDRSTPYSTLWKSDGTESGTVKIRDVTPWGINSYDNYNNYFCVIGKNLYFNGYDNTAGKYGLWKTNGYKAGTVSVTNVGIPTFLTNINKSLLFLTLSDNNLWISDGTSNGTKMLKNINGFDRYVSERCVAAGKFFLSTNNPDSALWISDGTINGTHLIEDSVIAGLTDIRALTGADNFIFLTGANNKYGDELYVADASNMDKPIAQIETQSKTQTALVAELLENPVVSKINLRIKSSHDEQITVLVSDETGFVVSTQQFNLMGNNKNISINCSLWKSGLYIVKLVNKNNNSVSINVLKQ